MAIEHALRGPTDAERALVEQRRATWHRHHESSSPNELLVAIAVAAAGAIGGAAVENVAVLAIASALLLVLIAIYGLAWRRVRRERATRRGPWDLPDGWRVRETTIRARAVCAAGSDDEDYVTWLVLELDGADWYVLEPGVLRPDDPAGACVARAELVIASIDPDGAVLSARASGDPLPRRGGPIDVDGPDRIAAAGDAYAKTIEAGFVWRPDRAIPPAGALVPAADLPAWMGASRWS